MYFEFDLDHSVRTLAKKVDALCLTNARAIKCNRALELSKETLHDLIAIPPKLSQLHLNTVPFCDLSFRQRFSTEFETLYYFLLCHQEHRLSKQDDEYDYCDQKIFLNGIRLYSPSHPEGKRLGYYNFFDALISVHYRNRDRLFGGGFPEIQRIDYQTFVQLTSQSFEFPFTFAGRYANVCVVTMNSPNDSVHPYEFYYFLRKCRGILELNILYASEERQYQKDYGSFK